MRWPFEIQSWRVNNKPAASAGELLRLIQCPCNPLAPTAVRDTACIEVSGSDLFYLRSHLSRTFLGLTRIRRTSDIECLWSGDPVVKRMICTVVLLFALNLVAQEAAVQPTQTENIPQASSEERVTPIPDAGNVDFNDPALTMTVTVDSHTLPRDVNPLPQYELAHSIAYSNESNPATTPESEPR